ncbi:MAG TPA: MBL fold metallo-hydrolase [Polyangiales bacterium]|nr:MBL fold metallo-hydrolase [Polyangiales bacterium]
MTNSQAGSRIDEIAEGVFRISVPVPPEAIAVPGGFTFNQFLIVDDEPLLFHTGPRGMFPLVREAMAHVLAPEKLRWVAFSHFEADECGSANQWLAAAPHAQMLCSRVAALVQGDSFDRPPVAMADGEERKLGRRTVRWFDAPHVPHGWDCGFLAERTTRTLFCGDLFTQPGAAAAPLTEGDILGPSEGMRAAMDSYFANTASTESALARLAAFEPRTLACMHGSSYSGDGAALLRALSQALKG